MKKIINNSIFIFFFFFQIFPSYTQVAVKLAVDINTGSASSDASELLEFNGKLYLCADDGTGHNLWEYDGTNAPTKISTTGLPNGFTSIANLIVFDNKIYFQGEESTNGAELWVYDGSNSPALVADIQPGSNSSSPDDLAIFNGKLYFSADDGTHGEELWEYDGINAPLMTADMSFFSSKPRYLTVFNNKLYFAAKKTSLQKLWEYDGINPPFEVSQTYFHPSALTVFNGKLIFNGKADGSFDTDIWEYDGTNPPSLATGVTQQNTIPRDFFVYNGKLYFTATDHVHGYEFWVYDGTNPPSMVADLYSGSFNSFPSEYAVFDGKLFFQATNNYGAELWEYDGVNSPFRVTDLNVASNSSKPIDLTPFNNQMYFGLEASSPVGRELFVIESLDIPMATGNYTSTQSFTEGDWTHYFDNNNNLLLSLEIGSSGAVINDNEVQLKIESTSNTYAQYCGTSPACFIDLPNGATTMTRSWDVNPTTQPNSGEELSVRFYFSQSEFDAVNTAIGGSGIAMTDLWFYKNTNGESFPTIPTLELSEVIIITNDASTPTTDQWVLGTKDLNSEYFAEFKVSSFSGGSGGGSMNGLFPLPVELIYFYAFEDQLDVKLKWATASETNNQGFEIQRSEDGMDWKNIGFVEGRGNSHSINTYHFKDNTPSYGWNYYRLKQIDFDGKFSYSPIQSVDMDRFETGSISVFPNPTKDFINITNVKGKGMIFNLSGQLVKEVNLVKDGINTISNDDLQDGIYQLMILQANGKFVKKRFVKMSF